MTKQNLFDKTASFTMLPDGTNYKGSFGEIIIDLTLPGLRIMDGCTCGGILQIPAELTDCAQAAEDALRTVYTLFSKFPDPHPDAASYPGIALYGRLESGPAGANVHPAGPQTGQSINGWNVFQVLASDLPPNDSNGHYWVEGAPSSFTGLTYASLASAKQAKALEVSKVAD